MQDSIKTTVISSAEIRTASESTSSTATAVSDPVEMPRRDSQTARRIALSVGLIAFGSLAMVAGFRVAKAMGQVNDNAHIMPGVHIAGIPVGGLTKAEAIEKVRAWARTESKHTVSLHAPVSGRDWNLTLADAGGRFDTEEAVTAALAIGRQDNVWDHFVKGGKERPDNITVPFRFNEKQFDTQLVRIGKAVYIAPKNARAKLDSTGQIVVAAAEIKGVQLDVDATRKSLLKGGVDSLRDGGKTDLIVKEETPAITSADIEKMSHRIGTYSTDYSSSSSNRAHNVEKATGLINGVLLAPGQLFSYNEVVGPREPELGWLNAPTIQDGQMVPGPGGGCCQVSTTLYNAVRKAGMEIVARTGHSKPVHYAAPGMDATVAYGQIDFKFRNAKREPVLIIGQARGGNLVFSIFGSDSLASETGSSKSKSAKASQPRTVANL